MVKTLILKAIWVRNRSLGSGEKPYLQNIPYYPYLLQTKHHQFFSRFSPCPIRFQRPSTAPSGQSLTPRPRFMCPCANRPLFDFLKLCFQRFAPESQQKPIWIGIEVYLSCFLYVTVSFIVNSICGYLPNLNLWFIIKISAYTSNCEFVRNHLLITIVILNLKLN